MRSQQQEHCCHQQSISKNHKQKQYTKLKIIPQSDNPDIIHLYSQISILQTEKKYNKILPLYNSLIQLESNNFQLYYKRAELRFKLDHFNQCIKDCQALLSLQIQQYKKNNHNNNTHLDTNIHFSLNLKIYSLIARAYIQLEDYDAAEAKINQFLDSKQQLLEFFKVKTALQRLKQTYRYQLSTTQQKILSDTKQWLYKAGSHYDKIKILKLGDDYRGAIATKHIKQKQTVVFVPYSHMITLQMAKQTQIAISLLEKKIQLLSPKHTLLAILLLQQARKPNSRWKLYIDILPKDMSCFPVNYSKEQLIQLTGSNFLYQIHQKVMDLKRDFDILYSVQPDFKKYSFMDFCWARLIIGSRIFGLVIDGVKTQALVPFADMLNHKMPKQTVWNYSQQLKGFFIESQQDILPGQQVFDSYGKKCNSRFLSNYAFVLRNNIENQVCFKMDLDQNDPQLIKKHEMMKDKSQIRVYRVSINLEDNNFYQLLGFIRFYQIMDLQTLQLLQKISGIKKNQQPYKPTRTPPVNLKLQINVWKYIQKICQDSLKAYPTTYQQDLELLKNRNITQNMRNILILRSGQKKIFLYFIQVGKQVIQILNKGKKEAYQYAKDNNHIPYCKYLEKILPLLLHTTSQTQKNGSKKDKKKNIQQK